MTKAAWYFDFISPFSYLQLGRFQDLPQERGLGSSGLTIASRQRQTKGAGIRSHSPLRTLSMKNLFPVVSRNRTLSLRPCDRASLQHCEDKHLRYYRLAGSNTFFLT
jgi:hypothetical protein